MFNLITGYYLPDEGKVVFDGTDITGMQPFDIVRLGMARAFQRTNIFPKMTVAENIVATIISKNRRSSISLRRSESSRPSMRGRAKFWKASGWRKWPTKKAGTLAHGNQKRLDIAVALALEPKLLLLDEPTAGMSPEERRQIVRLVRDLWERLKITMVFIEHDMDIVFGISQKVRVLCYKTLLAEGTPNEISSMKK